jgi:hypothetical protein
MGDQTDVRTTAVRVRQTVRDREGSVISDGYVTHKYRFVDGLVERMDVEEAGA